MNKSVTACILSTSMLFTPYIQGEEMNTLRVATFNVSMEAFNYLQDRKSKPKGNELSKALDTNHPQIRNIAEIIQRINPDIILLNEFDRQGNGTQILQQFINDYLAKSQNGQTPVSFPYTYQGPVNTGVVSSVDFNHDKKSGDVPGDTYGFGYFPGHFAMAFLSKYPFKEDEIRTLQHFKWKDMPGALKPLLPESNAPYYSDEAWGVFRLSSKSMWDIPVQVGDKKLHIIAAHPTPPVFDGPEDRNGKRNHDEIRMIVDYISPSKDEYLYDDKGTKGGLGKEKRFVVLGDLNASNVDGDALDRGIASLIEHPNVNDPMPKSDGAKAHAKDNPNGKHHTAYWGMRADYVLPSKYGITLHNAGVFWPTPESKEFRLIKDRAASSDHRMVWIDIELK